MSKIFKYNIFNKLKNEKWQMSWKWLIIKQNEVKLWTEAYKMEYIGPPSFQYLFGGHSVYFQFFPKIRFLQCCFLYNYDYCSTTRFVAVSCDSPGI